MYGGHWSDAWPFNGLVNFSEMGRLLPTYKEEIGTTRILQISKIEGNYQWYWDTSNRAVHCQTWGLRNKCRVQSTKSWILWQFIEGSFFIERFKMDKRGKGAYLKRTIKCLGFNFKGLRMGNHFPSEEETVNGLLLISTFNPSLLVTSIEAYYMEPIRIFPNQLQVILHIGQIMKS